jgi:hypothetical protein
MMSIFPFSTDSRNSQVFDLYETINSYIDNPNWIEKNLKRPSFICNDSIFSRMTYGNHRIWFHWGLSDFQFPSKSYAKSFAPLIKVVNEKIPDNVNRDRFWTKLCEEEHSRLEIVYNKTAVALGYNANNIYDMQREQIWAFATILYCIHILGDYTTTEYKLVREEKDLRDDIYRSIRVLAGPANKKKGEALIAFLKREAPLSERNKGTVDCSAQQFINALKDKKNGFSQFILACEGFGHNYKMRFKMSGRVTSE